MRALSAAKSATTTVVLCGWNQQIKRKAISRSKGWAVRLANLRSSYSLGRVCLRAVPVRAFEVGLARQLRGRVAVWGFVPVSGLVFGAVQPVEELGGRRRPCPQVWL